jgi:benzoyl-CoA reductase/2-hydroxyglutaryl-CoA dehydratase subunit BcrC/BadD/HgdB
MSDVPASEDTFNGQQIVQMLRQICIDLDINKPNEEILKNIKELVEKDGGNNITASELKKIMENIVKELNSERK